jgi:hypothetical protein
MPYKIDTGEPILRLTLFGTLTNDDLADFADEAEKLERELAVVPHRLTDLRPITRVEITFDGVLALANRRLSLTFPNAFKSAIVATNTVHFGFARMFETLNDHPQISIAIFPDSAPALEWLAIPGQAPPATLWSPRMASL